MGYRRWNEALVQRAENSEFDKKVDEKLKELFYEGVESNHKLHTTLVS